MLLEPPDQQHLAAAEGFLALGMYEDANSELEEIDPFCRRLPEVLAVRLGIYQGTKKWEMAQVVAKQLATDDPLNPQWPISLAYVTRRLESLEAAKAILLDGFRSIQRSRSSTTISPAMIAKWNILSQRKIT